MILRLLFQNLTSKPLGTETETNSLHTVVVDKQVKRDSILD